MMHSEGAASVAPAPQPPPLLRLRQISKRFGATQALADVSISFEAGKVHCLLGENGAGKSTIGKIIAGLFPADSGALLLDGREVRLADASDARRRGIAVVYQELSLAPDLSVRANLCLGAEAARRPWSPLRRAAETARVGAVLARLGLDLDMETPVRQLPAGMQQLVEIAKSLMASPRIVVFDEPTAMLGAAEKQRFFEVVRGLRAEGIACILVTHHMDDVEAVGDCVTIMRNGRHVDSFDLHAGISGEAVLEKLTGRREVLAASAGPARQLGPTRLRIALPAGGSLSEIEARAGEVVGFYGVLGCGAGELMYGLVGLDGPPRADYYLNGAPYRPRHPAAALRQGVGLLPAGRQSHGVLTGRSIRENLMLTQFDRVSRWRCIDPDREAALAREQLERAGVKHGDPADPIESLSGGNQQKALLARALGAARRLLLLHEPTAGVDILAKQHIHEQVRAAAAQGLTVVMLSSDLPEVIALCDTVYTFFHGTAVARYAQPGPQCQPHIVADVLGQREPQHAH
ncbi:sugar ABC transporter ATP-binding protein [Bordetella bronchiseptica]|uniref:sugar ABC transporter ATP-binding protein n=1 Tax=Bordetella bronchiseptica TaxID=518 RepID=UPI003F747A02